MRKRHIFTLALLSLAMSASAQIQLLYMDRGRNVIDRNKKLYWMDGDSDPCYDILNYKKSGTKETFSLRAKRAGRGDDTYSVSMTLGTDGKPSEITMSGKYMTKFTSKVTTTSGDLEEDNRLYRYFNGLAGNPTEQGVVATKSSAVPGLKSGSDAESAGTGTVKKALGKVKGLFGKKNKK